MGVHVDELVSEVVVEPASLSGAAANAPVSTPWEEQERLLQAAARLACDQTRTRAEGYDD